MSRIASWGWGKGIDGRDAGRLAAQQALSRLGTTRASLGLVFVSQEFELGPVMSGLTGVLGNVPLWGISTSRPFTPAGEQPRSVVIGLLAGSDISAEVTYWPGFAQNSSETAKQLLQALSADPTAVHCLLLAADGINGDISKVCAALTGFSAMVAGGLASGDVFQGKTHQIAGSQFGAGGLSAAAIKGPLSMGMGIGHGWNDIGVHFEISKARDVWVKELGDMPAAEAYSRTFGYPARDWAFPPLKELVRLYPLGIELAPGSSDLIIRSPLQVEVDGSLRMNIPVAERQVARLLVGDRSGCLEAAKVATRTALNAIGDAKPVLGLVLIDQAWQYIFQSEPARLISTIKAETGDIPLVGGYTLGQVCRHEMQGIVRAYNQNLLVIVFGE
jgi:hypothetical protein